MGSEVKTRAPSDHWAVESGNEPPQEHASTSDEGPTSNTSNNVPFQTILHRRLSRRDVLRGGVAAAAGYMLGMPVVNYVAARTARGIKAHETVARQLGFESIPGSLADKVSVPPGYKVQLFAPWGTPINGASPAFDEINASNSAEEQAMQAGDHHDGMRYFPVPKGYEGSDHGILCVNYENITQQYLHPNGPSIDEHGNRLVADEVRKEINAHGVGVIEMQKAIGGDWEIVDSGFNRRITCATPMTFSGPAAGSELLQTKYSPDGTRGRGTQNNCAHGFTPWGTYLTCEENWNGYFVNKNTELPREHSRYAVPTEASRYGWHTLAGDPSEVDDEFARFDASSKGASAVDDYRNEPNQFGWVVEIDPYDPSATPVKRTALGRMAHEGCWIHKVEDGKPLVFYMGDDARFEYIYKFVTKRPYHAASADGSLLDEGTLYVARFNEDGSGEWRALDESNAALLAEFGSLAGILVNTRSAADMVGATPMDRPEWGAVHPVTGEVYMTLTNNDQRGDGEIGESFAEQQAGQDIDAAPPPNPRAPNPYGHIIRWREDGDDPAATQFTWDIFVFGSRADQPAELNRSELTEDNQFASPDGLWFDPRGVLWIQTDDGSDLRELTNNQMLAVIPSSLQGGEVTPKNQAELRRFLVGPAGCEITGIDMTSDGRTMFVNVQHPGEDGTFDAPTSTFPGGAGTRPRSATLVITREDGGVIGL
ncbi:MAG: PhoX family protein [Gammaproteobacteria bacterium]